LKGIQVGLDAADLAPGCPGLTCVFLLPPAVWQTPRAERAAIA
jgi:hypothetical protein